MHGTVKTNLAAEPAFALGGLEVRPQLLEIRAADGSRHAVQPKVMQVLIVLADAGVRVVSRDELIERCWEGRAIGDDALNRIVAKLREIAAGPAEGSFAVETIRRVGYRLQIRNGAAREEPAPLRHDRLSRWRLPAAGALLAIAAAGAGWRMSQPAAPAPLQREPLAAAASDMETRGLSAVFEGTPERTAEGIAYLRQAATMSPKQAQIWGSLAMAYVLSLPDVSPADREAVILRVREAAAHAHSLDPREGRSIAALVSLEPTFGHWQAKDAALREALARAHPGTAALIFQRVQFLTSIGKTREALELMGQLNASAPLVPWIQAARIDLLAANGRFDEAERVADWAGVVWPRQRLIWFTRFWLAAFGGRPDRALALAAAEGPEQTTPRELAIAVATARALSSRRPQDVDAVLNQYRTLLSSGQGYAEQAVRAAAALGRPDEALAFADKLYGPGLPPEPRSLVMPRIGFENRSERNTALLFVPPASALYSQPGFALLSARIGLAAFWRKAGPPDTLRE